MSRSVATRLHIDHPLIGGAEIDLDPAQAHRLRNVLRLGRRDAVAGFNPRDGEWACEVIELTRGRGRLRVREQIRPAQPEPGPWLVFAAIKRAPLDWMVEKATELGVAALIPAWTARTQSERLNPDRLRATAIAAAEQCGRLSIPDLREARTLPELLAEWPGERRLFACDETGAGGAILDALGDLAPLAPVAFLVGPEGGFTDAELDAVGKLSNVTRVGLGPRVLRAETAAIAALAAFQAISGDWRRRRRR